MKEVKKMMYKITEEDIKSVIESFVLSLKPLKIKDIPVKEKRKYILLTLIIEEFDKNKVYNEKEINEILKEIYSDFAFFRRYLIDYQFLSRTNDGKKYWVNQKLNIKE